MRRVEVQLPKPDGAGAILSKASAILESLPLDAETLRARANTASQLKNRENVVASQQFLADAKRDVTALGALQRAQAQQKTEPLDDDEKRELGELEEAAKLRQAADMKQKAEQKRHEEKKHEEKIAKPQTKRKAEKLRAEKGRLAMLKGRQQFLVDREQEAAALAEQQQRRDKLRETVTRMGQLRERAVFLEATRGREVAVQELVDEHLRGAEAAKREQAERDDSAEKERLRNQQELRDWLKERQLSEHEERLLAAGVGKGGVALSSLEKGDGATLLAAGLDANGSVGEVARFLKKVQQMKEEAAAEAASSSELGSPREGREAEIAESESATCKRRGEERLEALTEAIVEANKKSAANDGNACKHRKFVHFCAEHDEWAKGADVHDEEEAVKEKCFADPKWVGRQIVACTNWKISGKKAEASGAETARLTSEDSLPALQRVLLFDNAVKDDDTHCDKLTWEREEYEKIAQELTKLNKGCAEGASARSTRALSPQSQSQDTVCTGADDTAVHRRQCACTACTQISDAEKKLEGLSAELEKSKKGFEERRAQVRQALDEDTYRTSFPRLHVLDKQGEQAAQGTLGTFKINPRESESGEVCAVVPVPNSERHADEADDETRLEKRDVLSFSHRVTIRGSQAELNQLERGHLIRFENVSRTAHSLIYDKQVFVIYRKAMTRSNSSVSVSSWSGSPAAERQPLNHASSNGGEETTADLFLGIWSTGEWWPEDDSKARKGANVVWETRKEHPLSWNKHSSISWLSPAAGFQRAEKTQLQLDHVGKNVGIHRETLIELDGHNYTIFYVNCVPFRADGLLDRLNNICRSGKRNVVTGEIRLRTSITRATSASNKASALGDTMKRAKAIDKCFKDFVMDQLGLLPAWMSSCSRVVSGDEQQFSTLTFEVSLPTLGEATWLERTVEMRKTFPMESLQAALDHHDLKIFNVVHVKLGQRMGRKQQRGPDGECYAAVHGNLWLGSREGLVTLLDISVSKPQPPQWSKLKHKRARPEEEVLANVLSGASLSSDFKWSLACAAVISFLGLATNSPVMVVASMLISPMMGPLLGFTYAASLSANTQTSSREESGVLSSKAFARKLMLDSVWAELVACVLTWAIGFVLGLAMLLLEYTLGSTAGTDVIETNSWPTGEMIGRGSLANLNVGVIFAIASGVVVARGVSSSGVNALVGVAISASLMPPVVNSGLCFMFYVTATALPALLPERWLQHDSLPDWQRAMSDYRDFQSGDSYKNETAPPFAVSSGEMLRISTVSLSLYIMNCVVISVVCMLSFKFWLKPENNRTVGATDYVSTYASAQAKEEVAKAVEEAKEIKESQGIHLETTLKMTMSTLRTDLHIMECAQAAQDAYTDLRNAIQEGKDVPEKTKWGLTNPEKAESDLAIEAHRNAPELRLLRESVRESGKSIKELKTIDCEVEDRELILLAFKENGQEEQRDRLPGVRE